MQIDSDYLLPDIEQHFRVSAGPGAGKTHWLVQHIKNVLHNSKRLGKTRRIACITYTNIAVETILERLGTTSEHVEVSTIHSFLYKHLVKPYAVFIANEFDLNVEKMDGHDDTILSNYSFLNDWKTRTSQRRITEDNKVISAFQSVKWKFDASNELVAKTDYPHRANSYAIKNTSYLEYKKMAWERGIIHHDDVLFFSYEIIRRYPFTLEVLRAKFPYFFVDEFQDSNPIQVSILKSIGAGETIVGIIGDIAQSIYGFQGAESTQFTSFTLSGIEDYQMPDNRRSTNRIIDILNISRSDLVQNKYRNEEGNFPKVFIGEMSDAYITACSQCQNDVIYTLSRDNITSNAMKWRINGIDLNNKLFNTLFDSDSNSIRRNVISFCTKAIELAREKKFKDAIKELQKMYKAILDKEEQKKKAMSVLCLLLSEYDTYSTGNLYEFHSFLKANVNSSIANLARGKAKTFYETHTYQQLALCVKVPEDMSFHRTIHKAKGDEFNNVLIVLKEESNLSFLLAPDLINNEEQRINYVAASRACENLFISIPTLSTANRAILGVNFQIEDV